jgi:hypothetical protein
VQAQTLEATLSGPGPACAYRAKLNPPGSNVETLTIHNSGNAELNGSIAVAPASADWLQVAGSAFTIAPGGADEVFTVTMDASAASILDESIYSTEIVITHNDPMQANPLVLPVEFFVFNASGWAVVTEIDTVVPWVAMSMPYRLLGGTADTCCGCQVAKIGGHQKLQIVPGPDPCEGEIVLDSGGECCEYAATFRAWDTCGFFDDTIQVMLAPTYICDCFCLTSQGDLNIDAFIDAADLALLIDVVFFGGTNESQCAVDLGDFNMDCFVDTVDLALVIDFVFYGGAGPGPCWDNNCWTVCQ